MKQRYEFRQPSVWDPWAILDERGTEICDGPHETAKMGKLIVRLINAVVALEEKAYPLMVGPIQVPPGIPNAENCPQCRNRGKFCEAHGTGYQRIDA